VQCCAACPCRRRSTLLAQEGVAAVAAFVRAHAGDAAAHVHACALLDDHLLQALPQTANMRGALDAGLIPLLLSAMRAHPAAADVQRRSLGVRVLGLLLTMPCGASPVTRAPPRWTQQTLRCACVSSAACWWRT
jgi:hypothetical protein